VPEDGLVVWIRNMQREGRLEDWSCMCSLYDLSTNICRCSISFEKRKMALQLERTDNHSFSAQSQLIIASHSFQRRNAFLIVILTSKSFVLLRNITSHHRQIDFHDLHENGGDLLCVLLVDALDLLELLAILVDNDGWEGGEAEVLLGGGVLVNVDLVGRSVGGVLVGSSGRCISRRSIRSWRGNGGGHVDFSGD
jgi:hypothetical protein